MHYPYRCNLKRQHQPAIISLGDIRQGALNAFRKALLVFHELRPSLLEDHGLTAVIRNRLEAVELRSGIRLDVQLQEVGNLQPGIEACYYCIAQEALNNVLRHAQAERI